MLNAGGGKRFQHNLSSTFVAVTPLYVHLNCSRGLRNRLVRTRTPNNVEKGGRETASTSFNIRDNKRNVEQILKQSLNTFKLIQHRFNKFPHGFKGVANGFDIALQQNRMDVEANVEAVCSSLNEQKQSPLCTCILNFGNFLFRPLQKKSVK